MADPGHPGPLGLLNRELAHVRTVTPYENAGDKALMNRRPDAWFLHDLPAHRGDEVAAGALDGERSGPGSRPG